MGPAGPSSRDGGGHGLSAPGAVAPAQPPTAKPGVVPGVPCDVAMTLRWGRRSKSLGKVFLRLKTSGISLVMRRALRKVDIRPLPRLWWWVWLFGRPGESAAFQVYLGACVGNWGRAGKNLFAPRGEPRGLQAQDPGESNPPPLLAFPAVCQAQPGGEG